jgi:hypothetical protein
MNIEFEYRFRDCGSYTNYNSVVFAIKKDLASKEIDQIISEVLENSRFFEASRLRVPEVFI